MLRVDSQDEAIIHDIAPLVITTWSGRIILTKWKSPKITNLMHKAFRCGPSTHTHTHNKDMFTIDGPPKC